MQIKTRVKQLAAQHGSLREAARAIGVDVGYLSRLARGAKKHPSDDVLEKIGLQRVVIYRLAEPAHQAQGQGGE